MVAGMVVGMWATMAPMLAAEGAGFGATCGLASLVLIWILNNSMRGVRRFGHPVEKGA